MGPYLPCSLITFAIATDNDLYQRCLNYDGPQDDDTIGVLLKECRLMERKISARTAGLLEIVDFDEPGQEMRLRRMPSGRDTVLNIPSRQDNVNGHLGSLDAPAVWITLLIVLASSFRP